MSDEKVEEKVEKSSPDPEKKDEKKPGGRASSVFVKIVVCLLAVAFVLVLLSSLKLNRQVADLKSQLTTLQEGEKAMAGRVLALEDEFVVLNLKKRLAKVKNSVKSLHNLQGLMADNQELGAKIQGLVDELGTEEKKLEEEIAGTSPKVFQPSRICPKSCYQSCPGPVVITAPTIIGTSTVTPAPVHAKPKAETPSLGQKSNSGWSKVINFRLFGN